MKRVLLTSAVAPILFAVVYTSCADDTVVTPPSGAGSSTTTQSSGQGGGSSSSTSAGTAGSTTSTTDTTAGTGGAATVTTTAGTAGTGMGGNGTAGTGMGGNGTAGTGMGGNGTAGTGMGGNGTAGTGMGGGGAGMGGNMPEGGMGGTGGDLTEIVAGGAMKSNFGFTWKDSWFISPCFQKQMADCFTNNPTANPPEACPPTPGADYELSGHTTKETFPLGGTSGTHYLVSFKFNGISEAKYQQNGAYADPMIDLATPLTATPPGFAQDATHNQTFYIGGTAVATTYNVLRLRVLNPDKTEFKRYYMNAFPNGGGWESHRTFAMSYAHTIEVVGGGSIEYVASDSNCRAIANCGIGDAVTNGACNAQRRVPNEPNLVLPTTYDNKPLADLNKVGGAVQPWQAQMSHFTITKIVAK